MGVTEVRFDMGKNMCIITAVLRGMENKGYIQRNTKAGDRRSLYVYLTDKGSEKDNRKEERKR